MIKRIQYTQAATKWPASSLGNIVIFVAYYYPLLLVNWTPSCGASQVRLDEEILCG